jgi:hypothetical protein
MFRCHFQSSEPKLHLNPLVRHNLVKVATSKLQQTEEADVSSCVLKMSLYINLLQTLRILNDFVCIHSNWNTIP